MDTNEAGQYWNKAAEAWTALTRAGFDVYRDGLNTPAFFSTLPVIDGLDGLDIGCGEGHNTRLLAGRGANMQAIDFSDIFIGHAKAAEEKDPLGIRYQVASATALPFADASFDFTTSFMCLMDIPDPVLALREAYRVLKPGGFFQFSITHPCFDNLHRKNLRDENGRTYAIELGSYFDKTDGTLFEWTFGNLPPDVSVQHPKFRVPFFNKTLSYWVNAIIAEGFRLEMLHEPTADDEAVKRFPSLQDTQIAAYFLHFRCRK